MNRDFKLLAEAYTNVHKCTCKCDECIKGSCKNCSCKDCECNKCICKSAIESRKKWLDSAMEKSVGKKLNEKKEDLTSEESFEEFLEKRAAGAAKLAQSAKEKGGYSILTAVHFAAKAKPYAESEKWANKDDKNAHYKNMAKEVYKKLSNLDDLSQKEFQALMGELEVWGEVYIRSIKPNSLKVP